MRVINIGLFEEQEKADEFVNDQIGRRLEAKTWNGPGELYRDEKNKKTLLHNGDTCRRVLVKYKDGSAEELTVERWSIFQ